MTPTLSAITSGSDLLRESADLTRRLLADPDPFSDLPGDARPRVAAYARRVAAAGGDAQREIARIGETFVERARPREYARVGRELRAVAEAGAQLAEALDVEAGGAFGAAWQPPPVTERDERQHAEIRAHVAAQVANGQLSVPALRSRVLALVEREGWASAYALAVWLDPADRWLDEPVRGMVRERLATRAGVTLRVEGLRTAAGRVRWLAERVEAAGRALAAGGAEDAGAEAPMGLWRDA